ncbi:helix-turn-helix domain-containing protein [Labilibacter sediminis]|nr:helix-turn-helix domain-containing protein [Labilibacter sediminis]
MKKRIFTTTIFILYIFILKGATPFFEKVSFPLDYEMKVTALDQDDDGFMWIGTREGLYRYDGFEMEKVFPAVSDSINWRKHQVISLLIREDTLWFSLHNGDVMKYNLQNKTIQRVYPLKGETKYQYGRAISMELDDESHLWIGLTKGLVKVINDGELLSIGDFRKVFNVWYDKQLQSTWVLHDDDVISEINKNDSIVKNYKFKLQRKVRQFKSGEISRGPSGELWASVGNNIYQYILDSDSFKHVLSVKNEIIDFTFGKNNRLWLNDAFKELAYYEQKTGKLIHVESKLEQHGYLGSKNIFALHTDRSGVLFVGTLNGLYKLDWTKQFFYNRPIKGGGDYLSLSQGAQLGIVVSNVFYWIEGGEDNSKLYKARISPILDNGLRKTTELSFDLPNDISILKRAGERSLWAVSKSEGLIWIDLRFEKYFHVHLKDFEEIEINDLCNGKSNEIWLASNQGLFNVKYNKRPYDVIEVAKHYDAKNPKLNNRLFTNVHYDNEGKLWICARNLGIFKYNPSTNKWLNYTIGNDEATKKGFTKLTSINETPGGTIWLGSTDSGVAFFDKVKGEFVTISTKNGLKENEVCAIVFENEKVSWISHLKGLTRIELPEVKLTHYSYENGLLSGQFIQKAGLKSENGIIFFANTQGWIYFNPSTMVVNHNAPGVVIKKYRLDGIEESNNLIRLSGENYEITIGKNHKKFELYVAPMSFTSAHQNKVAWKFRGEKEWTLVNEHSPWVSIPVHGSGEYLIDFKAANNDGIWSTQVVSTTLNVNPSFGGKILRIVLPILIVLFVLIGYYVSGKVVVRKRKKKVEEDKLSLADKQRIEELKRIMEEEKEYLNPELSLKDLADKLNVSTNTLSSIFNDLLNQNFYDYVNNYRVEHVKMMLNNKDMAHYTLLSIGFDAGFNSKSSFYRIFKKHTGLTPSEYQKKVMEKMDKGI